MADADGEPPSLKQNSGMQPSFSPEPSAIILEAKKGKAFSQVQIEIAQSLYLIKLLVAQSTIVGHLPGRKGTCGCMGPVEVKSLYESHTSRCLATRSPHTHDFLFHSRLALLKLTFRTSQYGLFAQASYMSFELNFGRDQIRIRQLTRLDVLNMSVGNSSSILGCRNRER